ncbi:GGDEF domain-containing protein [Nocardioides sp. DS6]|uniref:GGDEF domain-containing protein n=1 Tax=Nocardioides eburneus TaxID=3231482 RepID=A0ABV3SVF8_9ACTN
MLDVITLRVAFGLVALTVLVLFYVGPSRSTRSSYARWWSSALGLYVASALLFLCNGTPVQVVANPSGNAVAVLGSACVWAGARTLRHKVTRRWLLGVGPGVVLLVSLLDDPVHDTWTGGSAFLIGMTLMLALSCGELWAHRRSLVGSRHGEPRHDEHPHDVALLSMATISTVVAVYYFGRTVCFLAVGPLDPVFVNVFGPAVTTLLTTVMLVVVTFSMSTLSYESATSELRLRATRDPLTGVLNRYEFMRLADRLSKRDAALLVADLDGFKALNDGLGHAAGDHALIEFADVCSNAVGPHDLVGRLGGDEFALILTDGQRAEAVTATIRRRFQDGWPSGQGPTISFGIAPMDKKVSVKDTLIRADVALYRAKTAGRDRAVRYEQAG